MIPNVVRTKEEMKAVAEKVVTSFQTLDKAEGNSTQCVVGRVAWAVPALPNRTRIEEALPPDELSQVSLGSNSAGSGTDASQKSGRKRTDRGESCRQMICLYDGENNSLKCELTDPVTLVSLPVGALIQVVGVLDRSRQGVGEHWSICSTLTQCTVFLCDGAVKDKIVEKVPDKYPGTGRHCWAKKPIPETGDREFLPFVWGKVNSKPELGQSMGTPTLSFVVGVCYPLHLTESKLYLYRKHNFDNGFDVAAKLKVGDPVCLQNMKETKGLGKVTCFTYTVVYRWNQELNFGAKIPIPDPATHIVAPPKVGDDIDSLLD